MMSDFQPNNPISDPASQQSDESDTSIIPDLTADAAEDERAKTEDLDDDDLADGSAGLTD